MPNYVLLTGSTGLLGGYLLRDLLVAGHQVVVVVRSTAKESARERIESQMQRWESELGVLLPRPVCMEGNLCEPNLGLDEKSLQWLTKHCDSIVHSAAALTFFEEPNGEPWRTNVEGTRNVLKLCAGVSIRQMHYVSTAYVCGMRGERIMESDLDLGQSFRNDYERSKLEAETLVRESQHFEQTTVYRPTVIAGDSQTGYTNTYHGLFMYLQMMSVFSRNIEPDEKGVRHVSLQLKITGDEPRNVIPVDWASSIIVHLLLDEKSHGRTFHLAPQVRMTARQMVEAGYSFYNSTGVQFIGQSEGADLQADGIDRDAYDSSSLYREYEASDPEFDTTNLERFAGHLPCPVIDEAMLHRFMKYGEEDRWGKRRRKPVCVPMQVGDYLKKLVVAEKGHSTVTTESAEVESIIALDILGPGGGQWTVAFNEGGLVAAEPGIADGCSRTMQLSSSEFASLVGGKRTSAVEEAGRKPGCEKQRLAAVLSRANTMAKSQQHRAAAGTSDLA